MAAYSPSGWWGTEGEGGFQLGPRPTACPTGQLSPGWLVDGVFFWRPDFLKINFFNLVLYATALSVTVHGSVWSVIVGGHAFLSGVPKISHFPHSDGPKEFQALRLGSYFSQKGLSKHRWVLFFNIISMKTWGPVQKDPFFGPDLLPSLQIEA